MGFAGRVSALLFLLVAGAVANDQVFTTSGVTFGRSSREPRYRVEFHPVDSPFHPENGQESVPMANHEGKRYKCFLPVEETKTMKSMLPQNATNVIVESERRIKPKEPDELLEVLKDQCFYRHEGWWSYEFCYHGKIRQVHVDDEKVIQEFVLGEYDDDATAAYHENSTSELANDDNHVKDISKRYHVHLYKNGTVCDLTDIPRETEVRFVCSEPTVLISSIKEISSCKYVVTIQSPMLCKNPLFQQEKRTLSIHCNELPAKAESNVVDDSLPKEAQISIIPDQDGLHDFPKVQIWNDKTQQISTSLEFKTPVQRVRISQKDLVVVLLNKVCIYKLKMPPEKVADYETVNNPFGLCELGKTIVAFPGRAAGQVKLFNLETRNVSIIPAHESPLRALALSRDCNTLATASEVGTIIRLWSYPACTKLSELRRGVDPAIILSLAFSPSATTLAVTSDKSTLHIFDLPAAHSTPAPAGEDHKWKLLSKLPLLPRQFSDTYSNCSIKFEMGDEPASFGPAARSATLQAGIPGVPGGRPTKGLLGWTDETTVLVIGAGQDARWEKFVVGFDEAGKRAVWREAWRRYLI